MTYHWAAYAVVLIAWLAVDVIAAVSNDGVWVLDHAYGLREGGLVEIRYRYIGYPIFARIAIEVGRLIGFDPLFAIVLAQRVAALLIGFLLVRLYRWFGAAVFLVAFSVTTLVQIDYVLAESLAVGLAAIAAISFARFWFGTTHRFGWYLAMSGAVLWLVFMRLQFAVLIVAPMSAVLLAWWLARGGREERRLAVRVSAVFGLLVVVTASFHFLVFAENTRENEAGSRATETARSVEFVSAWRTVFILEGVAPSTPELEEFYADGTPWPSWRKVRVDNSQSDWAEAFAVQTKKLLDASQLDVNTLRLKSLLGGLAGGRYDDMSGIKQKMSSPTLSVRLSSTYTSGNVRRMGNEEFLSRYNRGMEPGALVTSPAMVWYPTPSRYVLGVAWILLTVAAVFLAPSRRSRLWYVAASVVPHIAVAIVGASFLGDTYRWLLPTLMFSLIASAAACGEGLKVMSEEVDPTVSSASSTSDDVEISRS